MSSKNEGVRAHFDRISSEWDAFYQGGDTFRDRFNRVFRQALFERFRLTLQYCGAIEGARVLDLGCGTGRYCVEFAKRGASRVVGIDFAPSMVASSKHLAQKEGVSEVCEFVCADFSTHKFQESFDIVLALGFFDYIEHAEPLIEAVRSVTAGTFIASFPNNSLIWKLQRRIRYNWIKKCPVFDYTADLVEAMYTKAGFPVMEIIFIKRGLFVVARL